MLTSLRQLPYFVACREHHWRCRERHWRCVGAEICAYPSSRHPWSRHHSIVASVVNKIFLSHFSFMARPENHGCLHEVIFCLFIAPFTHRFFSRHQIYYFYKCSYSLLFLCRSFCTKVTKVEFEIMLVLTTEHISSQPSLTLSSCWGHANIYHISWHITHSSRAPETTIILFVWGRVGINISNIQIKYTTPSFTDFHSW